MADDTLEKRFAEEKGNIKAESYQKVASLGGWAGGARTLWAVSTVGIAAGAAIGLVAPFFPLVVGASSLAIAASAIPASIATFASLGLAMGFSGGLVLGRISGSAAAVAQEQEKRMKEWTARQILHENPNANIIPDKPKENAPKKPFWQRIKDKYRTYMNPRVGLTMAAIGAVGGLILAAAFISTGGVMEGVVATKLLASLTGLPGIASNTAALVAYSAGVTAAFGALWTFNMSKITSEVTHLFGEIISGKPLGREWGPEKEKTVVVEPKAREATPEPKEPHVSMRQFTSYTELVAKQATEQSQDPLIKR
jgi:hypothetical protein